MRKLIKCKALPQGPTHRDNVTTFAVIFKAYHHYHHHYHHQDVVRWVLSDGQRDSHFIKGVGKALFSFAPAAWGYEYYIRL